MQLRKRLQALLLAVLFLYTAAAAADAHSVPDMERTGSIRIALQYNGTAVGGGTLTLYRVGQVYEDDGNYGFAPTGDFAACGKSLAELPSAELAAELAQYAADHGIAGRTQTIGDDGSVCFTELELGLYLLVQDQPAAGYQAAAPFLVSVPLNDNGTYLYDVDASPKVELETSPTPVPPPTSPPVPPQPTLPQTGQLNWPIPVLAALGLGLFSIGWVLCFGKKRAKREK